MSLAGILSSNLFQFNSQGTQDRMQQFRQDFQKLGQDLQTGNLTGAQADFAAVQKDGPQSSSSTQNSNPIGQAFQQLSTDLQSGNLTAAQQDYSTLQQDMQSQAASHMQRAHHHHSGGGSEASSQMSQMLTQLGQDLQSGNLTTAQQAYTSLQQDLQQYALANVALSGSGNNTVSATA
jgi:outer membrane protein assembly factor BamD (BamD/ComL family)